ncbi:MAG: hypothetical protein KDC80_08185 [Saprospiraceae bacterium]|nr:hypothetical protein [Saprospiraceae bacterium]
MAIRTVIIFCFLFIVADAIADVPKDTFRLANEAFEKGAVDDAIQLYESIASNDFGSTTLYYNLGTAYLKKENWPAARYYLEKARQEHPTRVDLNSNLEYVRERVDDQYNFPHFPLAGFIEQIHSLFGKNFISLLMLFLFIGGILVAYLRPSHWKTSLYIGTAAWILVFSVFLLERKIDTIQHNMAIVWNDQVQLYDKPEVARESKIADLRAGLKVRSLEKIGPWCRVDLADGTSGWIEDKDIRFL